ncbi:hypothetical protein ALQ54_200154 [Pseudomonas syringae]|nr:hypothetical protein ALQ54_200154 [Pseudomonas syringae]
MKALIQATLQNQYNHGTVPSLSNLLKITLNTSNDGASSYANLRSPSNDFSRHTCSPSNS